MPIRAAAGLFLAKYSVQNASQLRARVVRTNSVDLDKPALDAIVSVLAAEAGVSADQIHLVAAELVHDVLEWSDEKSETPPAAATAARPPAAKATRVPTTAGR